jgi:hypothetical protein
MNCGITVADAAAVENPRVISQEINLAATFRKPHAAKLRSFEVEQTRR